MGKKTYGCDDCRMLKGNYCKLWQIKIADPHNSHCESIHLVREDKAETVEELMMEFAEVASVGVRLES